MPDFLDVLRVMSLRANRRFKDRRCEPAIDRQRPSESHILETTIVRVLRHLVDVKAKPRVPFESTGKLARELFNLCIAKA